MAWYDAAVKKFGLPAIELFVKVGEHLQSYKLHGAEACEVQQGFYLSMSLPGLP